MIRAATWGAATALAVAGAIACSWLPAATAGLDAAACILAHSTEPPAAIAASCGAAVADVVRILDAHKAAMVREGYVMRTP